MLTLGPKLQAHRARPIHDAIGDVHGVLAVWHHQALFESHVVDLVNPNRQPFIKAETGQILDAFDVLLADCSVQPFRRKLEPSGKTTVSTMSFSIMVRPCGVGRAAIR